jgi:hypothetical protein
MASDASTFVQPVARGSRIGRLADLVGHLAPRVFSLAMLAGVSAALTCAVQAGVAAARDAFVAPAILSPDSDLVLANKIKLGELAVERAKASAELQSVDADITADDRAIARLSDLKASLDNSLRFTADLTSGKAAAGAAELKALAEQRDALTAMRDAQAEVAHKAEADERNGLISRTDLEKEIQSLQQLELALLENTRATLRGQADVRETTLAQRALTQSGAPLTPELAAREEQAIHVELEALRLESDRRSKQAQAAAVSARIAKIDELDAQLRGRPLYRAIERRIDVAFVPYTQLDGVHAGATVYSCVWGLFSCTPVGAVTEVVEGEVTLPDPWGTLTRGQYAVLDLWDREAAKSKVLRVHAVTAAPQAPPEGTPVAQQ